MDLTTLTLGAEQLAVLKTLLEFHRDNDLDEATTAADVPFEVQPFLDLCDKVGVDVHPESRALAS